MSPRTSGEVLRIRLTIVFLTIIYLALAGLSSVIAHFAIDFRGRAKSDKSNSTLVWDTQDVSDGALVAIIFSVPFCLYGAVLLARSGVGYSPVALCAALVAVEVPLALVMYTTAFLCSWFTVGLGSAGFGYLCFVALGVFGIGFPFAVASFCGGEEVAGYANSLVWCVMATFGGIAIPHSGMNGFYRPWLFWADPMWYWLGATVSAALHQVPVRCSGTDVTMLTPPAGLTCGEYLGEFLGRVPGYLQDPGAVDSCAFCPYSVGDEYAAQFEFFYSDRWRDWGVFSAFCVSTLAIAFAVSWLRYGGGLMSAFRRTP